jgi:hypothetical protein
MQAVHEYSSDIAFTPSIKSVQTRKGSRRAYRRMEARGAWQTRITPDLVLGHRWPAEIHRPLDE